MIHLSLEYRTDVACSTPSEYLRYHRTMRGLSTRELADKVGVVPATINLYEGDNHPMKHDTVARIAEELGIDHARLCDDYTSFIDYPCQELLREVRMDLSLSQAQIAQEIGVSQTSYSGWERGARTPRRKAYDSIVAALKKRKVDICRVVNTKPQQQYI